MVVPKTWWLKLRMWLLVTVLFGIVYALVAAISFFFGISNFFFYGIIAIGFTVLQYMLGPKIVEWSMKVKYVSEKENPELHEIVSRLAKKAGIPMPKIGISQIAIPNAFAFGRWLSDSRVCVTQGILDLLDKKELEAVIGHELSHLKHRDVVVITMISVIPMICWFLAQGTLYSSSDRKGGAAYIGVIAFILYFVTNLLVLYGSRIREYYADAGSVALGNAPHYLASALYKLVRGSARADPRAMKQIQGAKAFFLNDVSKAHDEIAQIADLDLDKSGHIDEHELAQMKGAHLKLSALDKMMELMSTHPNMLKRIKVLSEMK